MSAFPRIPLLALRHGLRYSLSAMDIILFGIQGSGKGTQAKILAQKYGFTIFEAGSALRSIVASGSELGGIVASYINQGNLVPFDIIMDVVRAAVESANGTPMLFDGIPRDTDQQQAFDRIMQQAGREFRCINLQLSDAQALERIHLRAGIEGRVDDASDESVRKRIQTFRQKTEPIIEQYRIRGLLDDIQADHTIEEVAASLESLVSSYSSS